MVRGISLRVGGWKARPRRLVAARAGKSHWLAPVLEAYDGRSAIEATREASAIERGRRGSESLDERRLPLQFIRQRNCWISTQYCRRLIRERGQTLEAQVAIMLRQCCGCFI